MLLPVPKLKFDCDGVPEFPSAAAVAGGKDNRPPSEVLPIVMKSDELATMILDSVSAT